MKKLIFIFLLLPFSANAFESNNCFTLKIPELIEKCLDKYYQNDLSTLEQCKKYTQYQNNSDFQKDFESCLKNLGVVNK